MIVPAEEINDPNLSADVCIVGSGPSGLSVAYPFLKKNARVVILESGLLDHWEQRERINDGEIAGLPFDGLITGRNRLFGGTTFTWAGQCIELDPIDFEQRDWISDSGWPFDASALAPFYRQAEQLFRIDEGIYDESIWQSFHLPNILHGSEALVPRFTVMTGFPKWGKYYRRDFQRAQATRVILGAHVTGLQRADDGSIDFVRFTDPSGRVRRVRSKIVVLCGGGIENARLLLLSGEGCEALGNRYDLVGRFFQDHPNAVVGRLDTPCLRALQDGFGLLYRGHTRYFPKLALSEGVQRKHQSGNAIMHFVFADPVDSATYNLREIVRILRNREAYWRIPNLAVRGLQALPQIAEVAFRRYARGLSPANPKAAVLLQVHLEQIPNRESRVTLGEELDEYDQRKARVHWHLADFDLHTLRTATRVAADSFEQLGVGKLSTELWLDSADWRLHLKDAYHHAGTTRMACSAETGVVDGNLRVYGSRNLFICGGSVFPTSGYANPTLTMSALGLRLAGLLEGELSR